MATKSHSYDSAAYATRPVWGCQLNGSGGANAFAAFTDMKVKSFTLKPYTAGTSNDTVTAFKVSGTTTTTHVLATYGSAATAGTNIAGTFTLAQNECIRIVKGTDATGIIAVGVELEYVPGADLTV